VTEPLLALEAVGKRFGAVVALTGATLAVRPGTVHAVLGENGAGKTTLMRIAYGMLRPDAGQVRVAGVPRPLATPADAIAAGLGMVQQHFALVPAMTVAENISLGGRGPFRRRQAADQVRALGDATGLRLDPGAVTGDLPVGAQQRVEILKALARDARILILDEPTAVLAPAEAVELLSWLRAFVRATPASGAHAVVLVTHRLTEALEFADDITVLRHGAAAMTGAAGGVTADALARAMLGEGLSPPADGEAVPPSARRVGEVVIEARNLQVADDRGVTRLRDATFSVAGGEIVGVAGVEGAGQRELLRVVAGRMRPRAGALRAPHDVGFVPDDRHRDALLLDAPLTDNLALRGSGARRGRMRWRNLARDVSQLIASYDVRAEGPEVPARTLSGGNQQKFVLAREMAASPAALVAENPTRGLDIRATAAVHARLRAARDAGAAVLVYSSDLDEVLMLADRILVLHAGEMRETAPQREAAGRAMVGAAPSGAG
jgi:ABC-type uncharacterized transport system ATPase subunit